MSFADFCGWFHRSFQICGKSDYYFFVDSNDVKKPEMLAEDLVARFLEKQDWRILARNFRQIGCELDIVAQKGQTLIIVEVKMRTKKPLHFDPEHLLPMRKRMSLVRGARAFQSLGKMSPQTIRFDLALVGFEPGSMAFRLIRYLPDAFQSSETSTE